MVIGTAAVYAAGTFVSTLAGGFFALRFSRWMDRIMAFSGGVLLAAGLLDLLPDAISLAVGHSHGQLSSREIHAPLLSAVVGFVVFYLIERLAILRSYHTHHHHPTDLEDGHPSANLESLEQETVALHDGSSAHGSSAHGSSAHGSSAHGGRQASRTAQVGILGAAGLCIHSFLDGFSIGVSFRVSASLGLLVAMAVIAHDFSDGVSTVTVLLSRGIARKPAVFWLLLDAASPLAGVAAALFVSLPSAYLGDLLGFFAGMFLYLGGAHMLPEAHALSDSFSTVAWMIAGVTLMALVTHWLA